MISNRCGGKKAFQTDFRHGVAFGTSSLHPIRTRTHIPFSPNRAERSNLRTKLRAHRRSARCGNRC